MRRLFYILLSCVTLTLPSIAPAAAQSAQPPPRQLVYSFSVGDQGSEHDTNSFLAGNSEGGTAGGTGSTDYGGDISDRGKITVDILGVESDQGLVVKVSEAAEETRNAKPATCVVYSNTNVLCPPGQTVNPEEIAIIRLLSPQFVDLTKVDAKQHWLIDGSAGPTSRLMNFTIAKNSAGMMQINEDREIKVTGAAPMTGSTQNQISYDDNRLVPLSIKEYTTNRNQTPTGYNTEIMQIDASLTSDSSAPK